MGTAELACQCLEAVAGQVVQVVTQPDRPKGRRLELMPPPVKVTAQRLGLPVAQPVKIREYVDQIKTLRPDVIVVVAYGQILPEAILEIPERGCINVHASLLPRWRGASPIQSAILAGDTETGITTMFMDAQLDHGDIILQRREAIRADDTSAKLHDRLAQVGGEVLKETLALPVWPRQVQDETRVTLARKFTKEDGRIDWSRSAEEIDRQVRAFNPWPGAFTTHEGNLLKIWELKPVEGAGEPGTLCDGVVGTGRNGVRLVELQPANGRRMSFEAYQCGRPLPNGTRFGV